MKKVLIAALLFLGFSTLAKADCYLVDYTTWGPTGRGTWACWDYKGNPYVVNMNLWQGLMDYGY